MMHLFFIVCNSIETSTDTCREVNFCTKTDGWYALNQLTIPQREYFADVMKKSFS